MIIYSLLALLFLLQLGDWYTTRTAINSGKGHEANPVAAWLMGKIGMDGYLAIKAGVLTVLGYLIGIASLYTLGALVAFYVAVVTNNWRISSQSS